MGSERRVTEILHRMRTVATAKARVAGETVHKLGRMGHGSKPRARAVAKFLPALVVAAAVGGLIASLLALPFVGGLGLAAKSVAKNFEERPSNFDLPALALPSRILDKDGKVIATFYSQNRIYVPLEKINPVMRQALLAIEDARFYEHGALDLHGTLRALITNLRAGDVQQGASSLTQQLVKNVLIQQAGDDKAAIQEARAETLERKLQELRYAAELEKRYTKDQIFEAYLNIAYFGSGAYGVGAAARYYFNTTADKLTLDQAALLAGIVKNPWAYDPTNGTTKKAKKQFHANAVDRRDTVLDRMAELKMIAPQVAAQSKKNKLKLHVHRTPNGCYSSTVSAPLFCQYVQKIILSDPAFGKTANDRRKLLNDGGLTIRTTLSSKAQRGADRAIADKVYASDDTIAAVAMVEPGTGAVRALSQSKRLGLSDSMEETDLNFAVDEEYGGSSGFQPGSSMKAFTAAAALSEGIRANHTIRVSYIYPTSNLGVERNCEGGKVYPDWTGGGPHNESPSETGSYTMVRAFDESVNNYFIKLTDEVGLCNVVKMAERLGVHRAAIVTKADIPSKKKPRSKWSENQKQVADLGLKLGDRLPLKELYSFTLGINEVSPLTMASAYATFASRGIYCQPYAIQGVIDRNGKKLSVPKHGCERRLSTKIADAMNYLFQDVIKNGTAAGNPLADGRPAGGKTGTTNDKAHGVWFIGFTPQLSTAVVAGDPQCNGTVADCTLNGRTIGGLHYGTVFGATLPAPIWKDAMDRALKGEPIEGFHGPESKYIFGDRSTVPDLAGYSLNDAINTLDQLNFSVRVSSGRVSSSEADGTVAYTSPSAGSQVRSGTTVTIYVSGGQSQPSSSPSGGGGNGNGNGNGNGVGPGP